MAPVGSAPASQWTPGCRASGVHHGSMVSTGPLPTRAWPLSAGGASHPLAFTDPLALQLAQQLGVAAAPFASPGCTVPRSPAAPRSMYPPGHVSRISSAIVDQPSFGAVPSQANSCGTPGAPSQSLPGFQSWSQIAGAHSSSTPDADASDAAAASFSTKPAAAPAASTSHDGASVAWRVGRSWFLSGKQ